MKHYVLVAEREDLRAQDPALKPFVFKVFSEAEVEIIWDCASRRCRVDTTKWCQEIRFE